MPERTEKEIEMRREKVIGKSRDKERNRVI